MTVAVDFSPRIAEGEVPIAERRLMVLDLPDLCFKRRSATHLPVPPSSVDYSPRLPSRPRSARQSGQCADAPFALPVPKFQLSTRPSPT
jgi:hypothetical protein